MWHRKLGHVIIHAIEKLSKKDLVKGLPKIRFEKEYICKACQQGKQTRTSFKSKKEVSTTKVLELLHLDLFGPISPTSMSGKAYVLVIVDNYSRYTWTIFLAHKSDTFEAFERLSRKIQNEKRV